MKIGTCLMENFSNKPCPTIPMMGLVISMFFLDTLVNSLTQTTISGKNRQGLDNHMVKVTFDTITSVLKPVRFFWFNIKRGFDNLLSFHSWVNILKAKRISKHDKVVSLSFYTIFLKVTSCTIWILTVLCDTLHMLLRSITICSSHSSHQ